MPSLSTRQKADMIERFLDMANHQIDRTAAQKMLKNSNYRLEVAIDTFFSANNTQNNAALEKMFDQLHDSSRDPEKNQIEAESMMAYLEVMGVSGESAELFVLLEIVQAPGFGQISRAGFVNGWKDTAAPATREGHRRFVRERIAAVLRDADLFKKVYRYAFVAGKDADQKALQLDRAIVFWDMFFGSEGVRPWRGTHTGVDFLALWKEYLGEKWTRSVNRDMWNQTLEFAGKSNADESLSFWSEDAAWPGVIDDFVRWCREGNKVPEKAAGEGMEVD